MDGMSVAFIAVNIFSQLIDRFTEQLEIVHV
jgi:hypothetical protein